MPIYQYRCQKCSYETEALQKLSDAPLVDCQACGKPTLEKCISASAFRLGGKGYYETDEKPASKQRHLSRSDDTACTMPKCGTSECG